MLRLSLAALGWCLASFQPALAMWYSSSDGPDVFGNTTVHAGVIDDSGKGLVVQCDKDSLNIAFIERATPSDLDKISQLTDIQGNLFIKIGNNAVKELDGEFKKWNDNFAGMVVDSRDESAISAVKAIGLASGKISVGMKVASSKDSASFDSVGSSAAISKVMKLCKLDAPADDK